MSIESHLVSLRTYLEAISSQNQEIISLLKGRGETLDGNEPRTSEGKPPSGKRSSGSTDDAFLAAVTQDTLSKPQAASKPIETRPAITKPIPLDKDSASILEPRGRVTTAAEIEKQLEAETGKDFVKTSSNPVTLAESDRSIQSRSKATSKKGR